MESTIEGSELTEPTAPVTPPIAKGPAVPTIVPLDEPIAAPVPNIDPTLNTQLTEKLRTYLSEKNPETLEGLKVALSNFSLPVGFKESTDDSHPHAISLQLGNEERSAGTQKTIAIRIVLDREGEQPTTLGKIGQIAFSTTKDKSFEMTNSDGEVFFTPIRRDVGAEEDDGAHPVAISDLNCDNQIKLRLRAGDTVLGDESTTTSFTVKRSDGTLERFACRGDQPNVFGARTPRPDVHMTEEGELETSGGTGNTQLGERYRNLPDGGPDSSEKTRRGGQRERTRAKFHDRSGDPRTRATRAHRDTEETYGVQRFTLPDSSE